MKVLSLAAVLGSVLLFFKKQESLSGHVHEQEVDCLEEKKEEPLGFVDFSGGTLGI